MTCLPLEYVCSMNEGILYKLDNCTFVVAMSPLSQWIFKLFMQSAFIYLELKFESSCKTAVQILLQKPGRSCLMFVKLWSMHDSNWCKFGPVRVNTTISQTSVLVYTDNFDKLWGLPSWYQLFAEIKREIHIAGNCSFIVNINTL